MNKDWVAYWKRDRKGEREKKPTDKDIYKERETERNIEKDP